MGLFSIIVLGCHGRPFWSDSFQFWEFLYIVSLIVFAAFLLLLNFYFIFLFCFQSLFSGRLLKLCLLSHYIEFFILTFFIAKGFFFLLWIFSLKKYFFLMRYLYLFCPWGCLLQCFEVCAFSPRVPVFVYFDLYFGGFFQIFKEPQIIFKSCHVEIRLFNLSISFCWISSFLPESNLPFPCLGERRVNKPSHQCFGSLQR